MHLVIILIVAKDNQTERWLNLDDCGHVELHGKEEIRIRDEVFVVVYLSIFAPAS